MRFYPILFVFLFWPCFMWAQYTVKGKVFSDKDQPIENASVYINNSTIGTITDSNGNFQIEIPAGEFTIVASHMGFTTVQTTINTSDGLKSYKFVLYEETNSLSEVRLKKVVYDNLWKHNLHVFTKTLLGQTKMAKDCKILNPKVLRFDFKDDVLTANSIKPIEIQHNGLGYLITYDLVFFEKDNYKVSYLGRIKYKELEGKKSKQKRWKKNREKIYLGSRMHFVRSLREKKLNEEGFEVNQFKRVINPERPTDEELEEARKTYRGLISENGIHFEEKSKHYTREIDSLMLILEKSRLPKFLDKFINYNLSEANLLEKKDEIYYLKFSDYLSIRYTKEREEQNYIHAFGLNRATRNSQISNITLLVEKVILDPSGEILKPLDYYSEGYWSYEQMADLLPLDYIPTE